MKNIYIFFVCVKYFFQVRPLDLFNPIAFQIVFFFHNLKNANILNLLLKNKKNLHHFFFPPVPTHTLFFRSTSLFITLLDFVNYYLWQRKNYLNKLNIYSFPISISISFLFIEINVSFILLIKFTHTQIYLSR